MTDLQALTRWLLVLLTLSAMLARAVEVSDDRGAKVTLTAPPQRIISILPSLTETVCALDACQRLVGVDRYSNYPARTRSLPQVGSGLAPDIEAIVALKPDLVLVSMAARGSDRLEALGLRVVALDIKNHADVRRVLEKVGALLDARDAQRVWREIDASVAAAARSLPPGVRNMRVYFEVNRGPYAAGEASFIGETLTRLGVRNIVPASLGPFPKLNPEFVVRADPDVIMVSEHNDGDMPQRPGWAGMRALREHRVCVFTAEQIDVLVRPGPRMAESAGIMAKCLRDKS